MTGIIANSEGIYPTTVVTVHFGSNLAYCHPNPFGECLVTIANPTPGSTSIYATYTGYGRSYTSPVSHVTITLVMNCEAPEIGEHCLGTRTWLAAGSQILLKFIVF